MNGSTELRRKQNESNSNNKGPGGHRPLFSGNGGGIPEGIEAQARQSCVNVGEILKAAGIGYEQVIKTTCFLADMADFAAFNQVYEEFFVSKPARSCVAVKELPKGVLCEIEAIGVKSV